MAPEAAAIAAARPARWRRAAGYALAALMLAAATIALYRGWSDVRGMPGQVEPAGLVLAFALEVATVGVNMALWLSIVGRCAGGIDRRRELRIYAWTALARRLPGALWTVLGRVYLYERAGVARGTVLAATAIESGITLATGTVVALALSRPTSAWWPWNLVAAAGVAAGVAILWRLAAGWFAPVRALRLGPTDLARWAGGYALNWVLGSVAFYALLSAVYPPHGLPLATVVGDVSLAVVVGSVAFFVPGGLGLREASLAFLLTFSMPSAVAIVVAALFRIWVFLADLALVAVAGILSCGGAGAGAPRGGE